MCICMWLYNACTLWIGLQPTKMYHRFFSGGYSMIGSSLEHLPWDIKGWCNFLEFPQGTMVECNQTRPPGAYGSPLMLMVIEMLLCLLFLPKYCSHQVICLLYAVLHLLAYFLWVASPGVSTWYIRSRGRGASQLNIRKMGCSQCCCYCRPNYVTGLPLHRGSQHIEQCVGKVLY